MYRLKRGLEAPGSPISAKWNKVAPFIDVTMAGEEVIEFLEKGGLTVCYIIMSIVAIA